MKKQFVMGLLMLTFSAPVLAAVKKNLKYFPEGERLTYTRLLEAYRANSLPEIRKQRGILQSNYPNSIHLDNAYYLTGMLQLQNERYGEAVRDFGIVQKRFINSGKRPAAMFALGVTYQRLNLKPQANRVFNALRKEYPGSTESRRAWMQMKLADKGMNPSQAQAPAKKR